MAALIVSSGTTVINSVVSYDYIQVTGTGIVQLINGADVTITGNDGSGNCVMLMMGGQLTFGTSGTPIGLNDSVKLRLSDNTRFHVMNGGSCIGYGPNATQKKPFCKLTANAIVGATSVTVENTTGWIIGDIVTISSTTAAPWECEERIITGISGLVVSFAVPLLYNHDGTSNSVSMPYYNNDGTLKGTKTLDMRGHVANLSRPIRIYTSNPSILNPQTTSSITNFTWGSDIMVMSGAVMNLEGVMLDSLGRSEPVLRDIQGGPTAQSPSGKNLEGKYSLHYHHGGNRSGQYIKNIAVYRSRNKGVVFHKCSNIGIEDSCFWKCWNHNISLGEDGLAEEFNLYARRNILMYSRRPYSSKSNSQNDFNFDCENAPGSTQRGFLSNGRINALTIQNIVHPGAIMVWTPQVEIIDNVVACGLANVGYYFDFFMGRDTHNPNPDYPLDTAYPKAIASVHADKSWIFSGNICYGMYPEDNPKYGVNGDVGLKGFGDSSNTYLAYRSSGWAFWMDEGSVEMIKNKTHQPVDGFEFWSCAHGIWNEYPYTRFTNCFGAHVKAAVTSLGGEFENCHFTRKNLTGNLSDKILPYTKNSATQILWDGFEDGSPSESLARDYDTTFGVTGPASPYPMFAIFNQENVKMHKFPLSIKDCSGVGYSVGIKCNQNFEGPCYVIGLWTANMSLVPVSRYQFASGADQYTKTSGYSGGGVQLTAAGKKHGFIFDLNQGKLFFVDGSNVSADEYVIVRVDDVTNLNIIETDASFGTSGLMGTGGKAPWFTTAQQLSPSFSSSISADYGTSCVACVPVNASIMMFAPTNLIDVYGSKNGQKVTVNGVEFIYNTSDAYLPDAFNVDYLIGSVAPPLPPPPPLPTVKLLTVSNEANESGATDAELTVIRSGVITDVLKVFFDITGIADPADYNIVASAGTVTLFSGYFTLDFPVYVSLITLTISAVSDASVEGTENVIFTIREDAAYIVDIAFESLVYILDATEPPPPPPPPPPVPTPKPLPPVPVIPVSPIVIGVITPLPVIAPPIEPGPSPEPGPVPTPGPDPGAITIGGVFQFPGWIGVGSPPLSYFVVFFEQMWDCIGSKTEYALNAEINGTCSDSYYDELCVLMHYSFYLESLINDSDYWFGDGNIVNNKFISSILSQILEICTIDLSVIYGSIFSSSALLTEVSDPFEVETSLGFILTETLASKRISELDLGSAPILDDAYFATARNGGNKKYSFLALQNSIDPSEVQYDNTASGLSADNIKDAIDELAAIGGLTGTPTEVVFFDGLGVAVGSASLTWDDTGKLLDVKGSTLIGADATQRVRIGSDGTTQGLISPAVAGADIYKLKGIYTKLNVGQLQSWVENHPDAQGLMNFVSKNQGIIASTVLIGRSDNASAGNVQSLFEHAGIIIKQGSAPNRADMDYTMYPMLVDTSGSNPSTFTPVVALRSYVRESNSTPWVFGVGTANPGLNVLLLGHHPGLTPQGFTNLFLRGSRASYLVEYSAATLVLVNYPVSTPASTLEEYSCSHIVFDTSSNAIAVDLPNAQESATDTNREFWFSNVGNDRVTINPKSGSVSLINGSTVLYLDPGASIHLISNDNGWKILSQYNPFVTEFIGIKQFGIPASSTATLGQSSTATHNVLNERISFGATLNTEEAQCLINMPANWDKGQVKVNLSWICAAAGAGDVVFECAVVAHTDNSLVDSAWQDVTTVIDTALGAGRQQLTSSFLLDPSVTPSTPIDEYVLRIRVKRLGADAGDTYASAIWFMGLKLNYKTNGNSIGPI